MNTVRVRYGIAAFAGLVAVALWPGSVLRPTRLTTDGAARPAEVLSAALTRPDPVGTVGTVAPPAPADPPPADAGAAAPPPAVAPVAPVAPAEPPAPTPSRLRPGTHRLGAEVDGRPRSWTVVVPPGRAPSAPVPLLVVLHGVGIRGDDMRGLGFEPLAAGRRTVVAYPDAYAGAWNDGRPEVDPVDPAGFADDIAFLRVVIDQTAGRTGADPRRVAVVGHSNGAIMAGRVACELADSVTAAVMVSGSAPQGFQTGCRPARPVAMAVVAAPTDPVVPYAGGRVASWEGRRRGIVASVDETVAFWAARNGCVSLEETAAGSVPGEVAAAGGLGCGSGGAVARYSLLRGGHGWYRSPTFDTTAVAWGFVAERLPGG